MNKVYYERQLQRLVEEKQIERIFKYIREEDKLHIIEKADELMNQTFTFDKPWDMERCCIPYHFDIMDWNAQRNDDEEWCFMLNRMDYLSYLMLAGAITKDKRYYTKGLQLQLDWIQQHQVLKQTPSTRTLDTGIRIMNMMETLPYLYASDMISKDELHTILTSIALQIQYLKDEYLNKYTLSNWGSIQTCAILSCMPLYEEHYEEHEIFIWAKEELKTQFDIQVYDDGMQWEQSTMYHIEVLNYGMKAIYYQRFYAYTIDGSIQKQVQKLCDALFYQVTPLKQIETFGDSDRACVCDVFTRATSLFENPVWKYMGYPLYDYESLYYFGCKLADIYAHIVAKEPVQLTYDGIDSGMFTMRSSWDETANFTMFTNGSLGSGHGHSDNLHVSVYRKGLPAFIDPGRYTYREDHPLRVELKSMKSHNSVIVDERACSLPRDSWGYDDFGIPLKNYARHDNHMHYIEGTYLSHHPLQVWTRKLIVLDCGIWVIVDEIKEDAHSENMHKHSMKSYFHVDPAMQVKTIKQGYQLVSENKDVVMNIVGEGTTAIMKKPCSLRYNELLEHDVITFTKNFEDETSNVTFLCDATVHCEQVDILQDGTTPVAKELAEAYKFTISDHESYTIVVFHKEIFKGKKICYCEGVAFHAKCIVIHEESGIKKVTRLRI